MKILLIDGQGGKMGKLFIEQFKQTFCNANIIAIGTNSIATAVMLKAGADFGATGENPVVINSQDADIIIGPIGIVVANSLLGEVTPKMAEAVGTSTAIKILIPVNKCNIQIVGQPLISVGDYINLAISQLKEIIK